MTLQPLIFICLILGGIGPVLADDPIESSASDLFLNTLQSQRSNEYIGRFIYEAQGQQPTTYEIAHWIVDDQEQSYLLRLDGPDLAYINFGQPLLHTEHTNRPIVILNPTNHFEDEKISFPYTIINQGNTRMAGHDGYRLDVIPIDTHRYGYELVIDKSSNLFLSMSTKTPDGTVLSKYQFLTIKFAPRVPDMNNVEKSEHKVYVTDPTQQAVSLHNQWPIGWVPQGFYPINDKSYTNNGPFDLVDSYFYSDGMASFSVFIEKTNSAIPAIKKTRTGAKTILQQKKEVNGKTFLVTVVGEMPTASLEKILYSMR